MLSQGKRVNQDHCSVRLALHRSKMRPMAIMKLGDRIRAARMRAGLTQREVAKYMGVDKSAVPYWELHGGITNDKLIGVARLLGVRPSELLGEYSEDDAVAISDPGEITVITLFKKLSPKDQDMILNLLHVYAGTRKPPKLKDNPGKRKGVVRSRPKKPA